MTLADRKTPESDESGFDSWDGAGTVVHIHVARRLERERDAAVEALKLCYDHCRLWHPEIEINNVGETARATLRAIEEGKR